MSDQEEYKARIGTVLRGKWTLDRLIGVGGMAAVYAATHKIGRTEAVKLLDPAVAVSEELRARFEQEAQAVNSIGHPGTVEIRDIDVTEDGTPFLVMELLLGETLAERILSGKRVSNNTLLGLVDELLDVLAAAHAKGIIHRDIKPENLFIQKDGSLKVLDFGIARMRDGQVRTMAGTMMGTVAYMPPEQIKGLHIDHRVDLFAVGATMFRTIAGRPVHKDTNDWKVGTKMLTEPAPPLASVAPHAPEWVCLIVDRALGFLPGRRYPDAGTMRLDVQAVRDGRKPPYATERHEAGDSPHVMGRSEPAGQVGPPMGSEPPAATSEDSPQARGRSAPPPKGPGTKPLRLGLAGAAPAEANRAAGLMPTTKPQLPAFVSQGAQPEAAEAPPRQRKKVVPATAPQMPAFAKDAPARPKGIAKQIAPTAPMMPVFAKKDEDEKDESKPQDEPAAAEDEPAPAEDEPAAAEDEPASAEHEPAAAEDEPASAEDEPAAAEDEPEPTDESAEPSAESSDPAAVATDDEAVERSSDDDLGEPDDEAGDAERDAAAAEPDEAEASDDRALEQELDDDEPAAEDDDEAAGGPDSSEQPDSEVDAPSERAKPARKGGSNWIVLIALLVAVLAVAWWWRHGPRRQPSPPPSGAPSATSSAPPASGAAR